MKSSDIATVVLIGVIGVGLSIWLSNLLLGNPDDESVSFKVIEVVDGNLAMPSSDTFNVNAINPTIDVFVGSPENGSGS